MPIIPQVGCLTEGSMGSLNSWFEKQAEKEAKRDVLKRGDRFGNLVGMIFTIICIAFFAVHLSSQTGFFTTAFGAVSAFMFFVPAAWGIIPSAIRFVTGKKSPARIPDIFGTILVLVAIIYFLVNFQFDFTHLADPLPDSLKWIIQWISASFVQLLMQIGAIAIAFIIPYQTMIYQNMKCALANQAPVPASIPTLVENKEQPKQ